MYKIYKNAYQFRSTIDVSSCESLKCFFGELEPVCPRFTSGSKMYATN